MTAKAILSIKILSQLQAKKDPTLRTLEARLRNARYLGELVKFQVAPFGGIFVMLKVCCQYWLATCRKMVLAAQYSILQHRPWHLVQCCAYFLRVPATVLHSTCILWPVDCLSCRTCQRHLHLQKQPCTHTQQHNM